MSLRLVAVGGREAIRMKEFVCFWRKTSMPVALAALFCQVKSTSLVVILTACKLEGGRGGTGSVTVAVLELAESPTLLVARTR